MWDALWLGADLATMSPGGVPYGAVEDGAMAATGGVIDWVGRRSELPGEPARLARAVHDLGGGWLTPGLIDCHTHVVYGGDRVREFEARLGGVSYEEIARQGGGIASTVRATRAAAAEELADAAARRLATMRAEGVRVVEIKSGYGLDLDTELRQLQVARALGERIGMQVRTTYLGAHALPPEFAGRSDDYIEFVCRTVMPELARAGLVDAVDAYCEGIAFSPGQVRRVFDAAAELELPVKLHADQLSNLGGAALAAEYGALSADHLEWTDAAGVAAMAAAGTVAVLLPGAFYVLRETKLPPIDELRRAGVPIAIATDCNPGSSPVESILVSLSLACTLFRLTPEEALAGVTRHAAAALGMSASHGTLAAGKVADAVHWRIAHPAELSYRVGARPTATPLPA